MKSIEIYISDDGAFKGTKEEVEAYEAKASMVDEIKDQYLKVIKDYEALCSDIDESEQLLSELYAHKEQLVDKAEQLYQLYIKEIKKLPL